MIGASMTVSFQFIADTSGISLLAVKSLLATLSAL